jgi:hypothetical protein
MKTARILFLLLAAVVLMGCPVVSKNMIGLEDYKLDAKKIDGTWINDEGAMLIKVIDADKGILKFVFLEDRDKIESMKIKIMKGNTWLYFNVLPDKEGNDEEYIWGRFQINDSKLIFWNPSNEAFTKAIEKRKIKGKINKKKNEDQTFSFTTSTVVLTDSAKNIIDLVEKSDTVFFDWDEPAFFIKLTKQESK